MLHAHGFDGTLWDGLYNELRMSHLGEAWSEKIAQIPVYWSRTRNANSPGDKVETDMEF